MKEVNIISKVVGRSGAEASPSSAIIPNMSGYATKTELNTLRDEFKDFLEGADADVIINKWQDLVSFLEGISEDFDLLSMLGLKADKSELSNYVTLATKQTITGEKNFTGGLKVNGSPIVYDATNKYWKLEGDLLVTGGVTMYASDSAFTPSTIMDAIATDNVNLKVVNGVLTFVGQTGGGVADSVLWDNVEGKPSWIGFSKPSYSYSEISGTPTLLSSFTDDVVAGKYLPLSGGTVRGILTIEGRLILGNGNAIQFTNADNKELLFYPYSQYNGDLGYYNGSSWGKVWTSANDGAGSGLDADLLDGLQPSELYVAGISEVYKKNVNFKVGHQKLQIISSTLADAVDNGFPFRYSSGLSVISDYVGWQMVTPGGSAYKNPYFRKLNDYGTWYDWEQLAFLTDNVASATKLETARTIWGQSFDGTANISGALSGATTGAFSSNVTIGGTLVVTDATTLKSTLSVASDTTLATKLTLNGIPIYKSQDDVLYIDGNLAVRGGITMYATDAIDVPSIIEALPIASTSAKGLASFNPNDFSVVDGYVSFIGSTGVDESVLANYAKKTDLSAYLPLSGGNINGDLNIYGTPQSVNNNGKMIFHNLSLNQGGVFKYQGGNKWTVSNSGGTTDYTILHSSNWSQYVTAGDGGNYLPLSGGTMTSGVRLDAAANIYLQSTSGNNWNILDVNGKRAFCVEAAGYVGVGRAYDSGKTYRLAVEGNSYIGGYEVLQVAASGAGSYNRLCLSTVYMQTGENWQSEIISDYYGNNVCTRGGFTHGVYFKGGRSGFDNFIFLDSSGNPIARISASNTGMNHHFFGDFLVTGGITMYSDIRKKTKLQEVELTLQQIADAPLIEHYYNSDEKRTTHVGSIAQYWASMNDWFCKLDNDGYYTMEIQNAALASAISIARELVKYESKTDRKIRLLKERVKELEDKIEKLENN